MKRGSDDYIATGVGFITDLKNRWETFTSDEQKIFKKKVQQNFNKSNNPAIEQKNTTNSDLKIKLSSLEVDY